MYSTLYLVLYMHLIAIVPHDDDDERKMSVPGE